MKKMGSTWEWQENGSVKIFSTLLQAVIKNSNGKKSFFNLGFFNGFTEDPEVDFETQLLGDHTHMSRDALRDVYKFMVDNVCMF